MLRLAILVWVMICACAALAQGNDQVTIKVVSQQKLPLEHASAELLDADSSLIKILLTDSAGGAVFTNVKSATYLLRVSFQGFQHSFTTIQNDGRLHLVTLQLVSSALDSIVIKTTKPFVELLPNKTLINLDAGITNVGTNLLETLEKLPGVAIDGKGNISLKGRPGVTVLFDNKPTYLSGEELSALLQGLNSSQVSQIELMDVPPAGLDAAGTAGVINLRFKKGNLFGVNGSLTANIGHGKYARTNNQLLFNYRSGKLNFFLNYGLNANESFQRADALRTYYRTDGSFLFLLDQTNFIKLNDISHNVRTGIDYTPGKGTSLNLSLWGIFFKRSSTSKNDSYWEKYNQTIDSIIYTRSEFDANRNSKGAALNLKHSFGPTKELSADVDVLGYRLNGNQLLNITTVSPMPYVQAFRADIPSRFRIFSAKADYVQQVNNGHFGFGWKSSKVATDNTSAYEYWDPAGWKDDPSKSNHFLYNETIHALYATAQSIRGKFSFDGGLRFEATAYDAHQLVKDSSFSRRYNGFFPTAMLSFQKDSANLFSLSVARRIDRPQYTKLNPFLFIINKYTYQQGNPYYRPQYTWNIEVGHTYKNALQTTLLYSVTTDYFSQIFPIDGNGIVIYTEGNLSRMQNLSAAATLQQTPANWWSFSLQGVINRKWFEGVIGRPMTATVTQYQFNLNNQFRFKSGWTGEISGIYNSKSQEDLQEVLDPYGQLSFGLAKSVAKNKGTLKLSVRDVLYTNWIKGTSYFNRATERFKLTTDTRAVLLSFTWRFGRAYKTERRSNGAAADEIQRATND